MEEPIRRIPALQPISHEHHQGLLVCWKIKTGLAKCIAPERIKLFADFYYKNHLLEHFRLEEEYILPILGNENELVKQTLTEHKKLRQLFEQEDDLINALLQIEMQLRSHIRFEERVLLNKIQKVAGKEDLLRIEGIHSGNKAINQLIESWADEFWK